MIDWIDFLVEPYKDELLVNVSWVRHFWCSYYMCTLRILLYKFRYIPCPCSADLGCSFVDVVDCLSLNHNAGLFYFFVSFQVERTPHTERSRWICGEIEEPRHRNNSASLHRLVESSKGILIYIMTAFTCGEKTQSIMFLFVHLVRWKDRIFAQIRSAAVSFIKCQFMPCNKEAYCLWHFMFILVSLMGPFHLFVLSCQKQTLMIVGSCTCWGITLKTLGIILPK